MKAIEIESWALRILERVESHLPVEDQAVEIKADWPDPAKAARRIAGHANAARGENILWIIGADEDKGVVGANYQELSSWHAVMQSGFEGISPDLQNLNVSYKSKTVAALCFNTSRSPYVVKNPAFGKIAGEPVEFEVPWREGTKTRSATRNDLILLLSPISRIPKIEILDGEISLIPKAGSIGPRLSFNLKIYVVLIDSAPITFPFHKCSAVISAGSNIVADRFDVRMDSSQGRTEKQNRLRATSLGRLDTRPVTNVHVKAGLQTIESTPDDIVIRGSGKVEVDGLFWPSSFGDWSELELKVTLTEAVTESQLVLAGKFLARNFLRTDMQAGESIWTLAK